MNSSKLWKAVAAFFFLLAIYLPGCGKGQVMCGPSNCAGCCDSQDVCQPGSMPYACGTEGNACEDCELGDCLNGACAVPTCASGYHDEEGVCVEDQACLENTCAGHGVCDDTSGVPICTCETEYTGDQCESCASGYQDNDMNSTCLPDCDASGLDCGLHGNCDDASGVANCNCNTGWAGQTCRDCAGGYHDESGDCVTDTSCQESTCSSHGTCDDSGGVPVCACEAEYIGEFCDACAVGYQDNDDDGSCEQNCMMGGLICVHGY